MKKMKKGFTIVELVIVIGVIAILSAILIPTFTNLTSKANAARAQSEVADAYTAYVLDAQDGKIGDAGDPLVLANQEDVVLKRENNYFTYDQSKGWEDKGTATPTKSGYALTNVASSGESKYNNVLVQYWKATA